MIMVEKKTALTGQAAAEAPKVLIVDDESALQQAIKMALKNEGYQLYFADNGERGLELFEELHPKLVFLDLKMPVMDGYQFLESINIIPDALYTIVAITGHGFDRDIERCYKLGVDFFLKKPLSMVEICCIARSSQYENRNGRVSDSVVSRPAVGSPRQTRRLSFLFTFSVYFDPV